MFKNYIKIILIFTLMVVVASCSTKRNKRTSSTATTPPRPIKVYPANTGAEIISGTDQVSRSEIKNYKVQTSTGAFYGELRAKSSRGYKFFSTVQGNLVSSSEVKSQ